MNSRQWKQLASEYLLPHLPGFMVSGRWLFNAPISWQVRGFTFEPSGWDKQQFTLSAGVLPLYVPQTPGLTFTEGIGWLARKQRGDIWWNLGQASVEEIFADLRQRILQDGVPYLEKRATVEAMTMINHHQIIHLSADSYVYQAMLCAGILLDDARIVEQEWQRFTAYHAKYAAPDSPEWMANQYKLTEHIYRQYQVDPVLAREEIVGWRLERATELGLSTLLASEPNDLRGVTRPRLHWFGG